MSTQKADQITASLLNSSLNRFRHGGAAETLFLVFESPEEFFELLEDAFEQHKPAYRQDAALVTDSVRARWILNRRQNTSDQFEASRYENKYDGRNFIPNTDLGGIDTFDRYVTAAERALTRALQKLHLIKKMDRDDERWQFQLEREKKKFGMDVQLFELRKQREQDLAESAAQSKVAEPVKDPAELRKLFQDVEESPKYVSIDDNGDTFIEQHIWSVFDESGEEVLPTEVVPTNYQANRLILSAELYQPSPVKVIRTYHFKGTVPEKHYWLFEKEAQRHVEHQEFKKTLTFEEWREAVAKEAQSVPLKTRN